MHFKYQFKPGELSTYHTLNGRRDFHCRVHAFLQTGVAVWTKDGYDILTLSEAQQAAFTLKVGDLLIIYDNRVWLPFTAFKENTPYVVFGRFKIGKLHWNALAMDIRGSRRELYTTCSAVYAFTLRESSARTMETDRQRKALVRWIGEETPRARLPVEELTPTDTKVISHFVQGYCESPSDHFVIVNWSSDGRLENDLRIAFAHLASNYVLRYLWNKHCWCGLYYRSLDKGLGVLYNNDLCICSVGRGTREANHANSVFTCVFPEDALGLTITKPVDCLVQTSILNDLTNTIDLL